MILFHGEHFTSAIWNDIGTLEDLASSGYRVVALELPGHGLSSLDPKLRPAEFIKLFIQVSIASCKDILLLEFYILSFNMNVFVPSNLSISRSTHSRESEIETYMPQGGPIVSVQTLALIAQSLSARLK